MKEGREKINELMEESEGKAVEGRKEGDGRRNAEGRGERGKE